MTEVVVTSGTACRCTTTVMLPARNSKLETCPNRETAQS